MIYDYLYHLFTNCIYLLKYFTIYINIYFNLTIVFKNNIRFATRVFQFMNHKSNL